jgi:hypothetical protein
LLALHRLIEVMPVLIGSGSVGLVWPRLRHRAAEYGAVGVALEEAFRSQAAHNALVEERIGQAATRLQGTGIDPVIIKGWSLARMYPKGLIRTAGDIDLVVPERDFGAALETLYSWAEEIGEITIELHHTKERPNTTRRKADPDVLPVNIDLHRDTHWDSSPGPDALRHARRIPVRDGIDIRVLSPEDNLRQMCFHYLWHGGTRMLRLCDIALVLENRPALFDWERCLGADPVRANWVTTALGLAHQLLGACVDETPIADAVEELPDWLLPVARRQVMLNQPAVGDALAEVLAAPRQVVDVFKRRWPDPISATMRRPARFDERARLPIQLAVYAGVFTRFGREDLIPHTKKLLWRRSLGGQVK